jgi:hypothetical protein
MMMLFIDPDVKEFSDLKGMDEKIGRANGHCVESLGAINNLANGL